MDRFKLLTGKKCKIEDELAKWALKSKILKPGEHLRFSIEIVRVPISKGTILFSDKEGPQSITSMPLGAFFTDARGRLSGVTYSTTRKIRRRLEKEIKTIGDLLEYKRYQLKTMVGIGEATVYAIEKMLKEVNMKLAE